MIRSAVEARQQKEAWLQEQLAANAKELVKVKLSGEEGPAKETALLKKLRRERARLLTVLKEKEVLGKV